MVQSLLNEWRIMMNSKTIKIQRKKHRSERRPLFSVQLLYFQILIEGTNSTKGHNDENRTNTKVNKKIPFPILLSEDSRIIYSATNTPAAPISALAKE